MGRLLNSWRVALVQRCQSLWQFWDAFWFDPLEPRLLGLLRILTGLMLIYTHIVWGLKLEAFFGPAGYQDPILVQLQSAAETPGLSFWWYVSDAWRWPAHLLCLALLGMYTLGLATAVTKWTAFLITISYANRALNANFGLDQINGLLTLYLALGPCGAAFSIDRWWRDWRAGLGRGEVSPLAAPRASARLSIRLIQVHLCVLYFFAGISKLKGEAWWTGDAVWMALANKEYQSWDLTWLAWYPWVTYVLTPLTIVWEVTFPIAVWIRRLRPWVLLGGVMLHLGIGAFLGMWTFGLIMIVAYTSFLDPDWLFSWITSRRSVTAKTSETHLPQPIGSQPARQIPTRGGADGPRVLVLHGDIATGRLLADDLVRSGMVCTCASNVSQAEQVLARAGADIVLLIDPEGIQLSELLQLRQQLLAQSLGAPATLTVVPRGLPTELPATEQHRCLRGAPLFEELRRHLLQLGKQTEAGSSSLPESGGAAPPGDRQVVVSR
jgi:hypothetical protein